MARPVSASETELWPRNIVTVAGADTMLRSATLTLNTASLLGTNEAPLDVRPFMKMVLRCPTMMDTVAGPAVNDAGGGAGIPGSCAASGGAETSSTASDSAAHRASKVAIDMEEDLEK